MLNSARRLCQLLRDAARRLAHVPPSPARMLPSPQDKLFAQYDMHSCNQLLWVSAWSAGIRCDGRQERAGRVLLGQPADAATCQGTGLRCCCALLLLRVLRRVLLIVMGSGWICVGAARCNPASPAQLPTRRAALRCCWSAGSWAPRCRLWCGTPPPLDTSSCCRRCPQQCRCVCIRAAGRVGTPLLLLLLLRCHSYSCCRCRHGRARCCSRSVPTVQLLWGSTSCADQGIPPPPTHTHHPHCTPPRSSSSSTPSSSTARCTLRSS